MSIVFREGNPGHYLMLLMGNDTQAAMKKFIVPGVRGFQKRYYWRDLEPVKGIYDFTELASDVAFCAANGMILTAMIQDKSFSGPTHVLPKGMEAYEIANHAGTSPTPGNPNYGGYTSKRWDPAVVIQCNLLTKNIGLQFDKKVGFGGVATCETSLSLDYAVLDAHGYTPEQYRDSYINTLMNAALNMPYSNVYWTMNFLAKNSSYLGEIANAVRAYGVQMGGPDCLPNSVSLVTGPYLLYEQYKGRIRLFIQVSPPGYAIPQQQMPTPYMTMDQILGYAKDHLYVNTMFWYPVGQSNPQAYSWKDAVPVIGANPVINP